MLNDKNTSSYADTIKSRLKEFRDKRSKRKSSISKITQRTIVDEEDQNDDDYFKID